MVSLDIDGKQVEAEQGACLLQVCLDNGIYVPNLCYMPKRCVPQASCRLCMVAIDGRDDPQISCTVKVQDGMVVRSDLPAIRKLQQSALKMLLSVHHIDCRNCPANRRCELQKLARFLKVGLKAAPLGTILKEPPIVSSHPCIDHYANRCVLCAKCVETCGDRQGQSFFSFAGRGFATVLTAFGSEDSILTHCSSCQACIDICPVGALLLRDEALTDGTQRVRKQSVQSTGLER